MFRFIYYSNKTIKNCFNFLTQAYLVKTSVTHNKYATCRLLEVNYPILVKFAAQITSWYLRELELPKNWPADKFFRLRKSKFWERQQLLCKYLTFLYLITFFFFFFLNQFISSTELKTFLYLITYLFLFLT